MKFICAVVATVLSRAGAVPVIGEYGDGNSAADEWDATVVGGDKNTVRFMLLGAAVMVCGENALL